MVLRKGYLAIYINIFFCIGGIISSAGVRHEIKVETFLNIFLI